MRRTNGSDLLFFFAGTAVGIAAGMLMAPRSGADTRRYITDHGRDLYDQGRSLADEAATMFEDGRRLVEREEM